MYKGEDGSKIDLLSQVSTEEGNGTIVSIQLKGEASSYSWRKPEDFNTFVEKIKEQLAYFHGVYFEVEGLDNAFEIIEGDDWKYSSLISTKYMHLCLDDVYYSIDWEKLGVKPVEFPIGLKFKVTDGLVPTPNRESILLTPTIKELIKAKIKTVATYFSEKYNETVVEFPDIVAAWHYIGSEEKTYRLSSENHSVDLNVNKLKDFTDVQLSRPGVKGINNVRLHKYFKQKFEYTALDAYSGKGGLVSNSYGKYCYSGDLERRDLEIFHDIMRGDTQKYLICTEKPNKIMMDYLKDNKRTLIFVFKDARKYKLFEKYYGKLKTDGESLYAILNLFKIERSKWRETINEYFELVKQVVDKLPKISDVVISEEWLAERKANRKIAFRNVPDKTEINYRPLYNGNRTDSCVGDNTKIKICDIHKNKGVLIYHIDKERLKEFHTQIRTCMKKSEDKVILVSTRDFNKLNTQTIHNCINLDVFMEGKTSAFSKYCTSSLIHKFLEKNDDIVDNSNFIGKLSKDLEKQIKVLEKYKEKNGYINERNYSTDTPLYNSMIETCTKLNLWDMKVYGLLKSVEIQIAKFDFIPLLKNVERYGTVNNDSIPLAVEILKGRKVKLNKEHYKQPTPIVIEQPIEEIVQEEEIPEEKEAEINNLIETEELELNQLD